MIALVVVSVLSGLAGCWLGFRAGEQHRRFLLVKLKEQTTNAALAEASANYWAAEAKAARAQRDADRLAP